MVIKHTTIQLFFLAAILSMSVSAQTSFTSKVTTGYSPKTKTVFYRIGETQFPVKISQYGDVKKVVYLNLHADESTALKAARLVLKREGGTLISLENSGKRNIRFKLNGRYYMFDPNRMFSKEGAGQTLAILSKVNGQAIKEIEQFGKKIIELLPTDISLVVALHNNTDGKFGINSYLPGAERERDARLVYADPAQDPDDIYLTTDSLLYQHLTAKKYNSILQDNIYAKKDGSLSIYCGEKEIPYLNCETQHGRFQQYVEMLEYALIHLQKTPQVDQLYTFKIDLSGGETFVSKNEIYFGDEIIGQVVSTESIISDGIMQGQLQLKNGFELSSNMDLFMFVSNGMAPRIELRIDPTRSGSALTAGVDTLFISIRK